MSYDFEYGSDMVGRPIVPFVTLLMAAALIYFVAVYLAGRTPPTRSLAYGVFAVGALMRLVTAVSQPILEDDFYRYLWDGALTARGHNPYALTPAAVQRRDEAVPVPIGELGDESGIVLHRVNHPQLGTVYPPVAQVAFAVAHQLAPWRLSGLRVLYYGLDIAVFALLIALLKSLDRSPLLVLIYWWNPLALKEVYNSVHMDLLLVPLLLGALLLFLRGRLVWSMAPLALAVAIKLWPLLLAPPLLAPGIRQVRRTVVALAIFVALALLLLAPAFTSIGLGHDSGFAAYGMRWEMNDALFMIFPWIIRQIGALTEAGITPAAAHRGAKVVVATLLVLIVLGLSWRSTRANTGGGEPTAWSVERKRAWCRSLLWIVAALFLLSPTQFPWYYLWLLPFLTLTPNRALLSLTIMLPIYYLRFYYDALGHVEFFHYRVVWWEYAPVWVLLVCDGLRARRTTG